MNLSNSPFFRIIIGIIVSLVIFGGSFYASSQALLSNIFNRSVWITLAIYHVLVLILGFVAILAFSKAKLSSYGFKKGKTFPFLKILLNGLLIGALAGYIIYSFNKEELGFIAFYKLWEKVVFIWLLSSVCEEILISGFLQSYMSPAKKYAFKVMRTSISVPVIISGLIFSVIYIPHLFGMKIIAIALIMLSMFILGISKAYFREKTESLLAPIFLHIIFNASVFGIVYYLK